MKNLVAILIVVLLSMAAGCRETEQELIWRQYREAKSELRYWSKRTNILKKQAAVCKQNSWACRKLQSELQMAQREVGYQIDAVCVIEVEMVEMGEIKALSALCQ